MMLPPLSRTYHGRRVLELPGFELAQNCITALIGANGSGKSTLARLLAGVEVPDERKLRLLPEGLSVAYMPQKNYAFRLSVRQNVLLGAERRNDKEQAGYEAEQLLERLGLKALAAQSAPRLSGGETARMCLARTLLTHCSLLIFDEPTAAMDVRSTLIAEELIREYQRQYRATVLLVTHSLKQALRLADRAALLDNGRVVEQGTAQQVLTAPQQEATRRFIEFYSL